MKNSCEDSKRLPRKPGPWERPLSFSEFPGKCKERVTVDGYKGSFEHLLEHIGLINRPGDEQGQRGAMLKIVCDKCQEEVPEHPIAFQMRMFKELGINDKWHIRKISNEIRDGYKGEDAASDEEKAAIPARLFRWLWKGFTALWFRRLSGLNSSPLAMNG